MGAKSYWGVKVWTAVGGTSYNVPNVQSISFNYGRTQPTDDFSAAQATVTGILPDSLPALFKTINSPVSFDLYDLSNTLIGRYWVIVKSLTRTYGTVANLDTWQMTGVGWISQLTEQQLTSDYSTTAGAKTLTSAKAICDTYSITNTISADGESSVSGTTFASGTYVSDVVQQLVRTEQGRIVDCITGNLTFYSRSDAVGDSISQIYADDNSFPLPARYTSVDFLNTGDYLANTVVVEPEGLATIAVGTTRPVLSFQTLDQTSAQATDLANYIKNTLNLNTVRPQSITYLLDSQTINLPVPPMPGNQVLVVLRGVTYGCVVEGVEVTASPSVTTVTLNLSSADAYTFLRLDDVTFGILDTNKLGF